MKEQIIVLLIVFGIMYLAIIHFAYFVFGAYFKGFFNQQFSYWSIYTLQFKMKEKMK